MKDQFQLSTREVESVTLYIPEKKLIKGESYGIVYK